MECGSSAAVFLVGGTVAQPILAVLLSDSFCPERARRNPLSAIRWQHPIAVWIYQIKNRLKLL
jgi:hypothetical protein